MVHVSDNLNIDLSDPFGSQFPSETLTRHTIISFFHICLHSEVNHAFEELRGMSNTVASIVNRDNEAQPLVWHLSNIQDMVKKGQ